MALENRGNKITSQSQSNAAWSMVADKWAKAADQRFDTFPGGPRDGGGNRGPGKKNTAKRKKLQKIAGVGRQRINTNPAKNTKPPTAKEAISAMGSAKPGKTTISSMAKVRGRIVGGGMGGMFGIKNR